jgi:diaminopimelate decarboxylase
MLDDETLLSIVRQHGAPLYVYSLDSLKNRAQKLLALKLPFGFTPRYAAKANMNPEIITLFNNAGLWFDASSSYEAMELIEMGVEPHKISLSSQQPAHNLNKLLEMGVQFTATSLHQLELLVASPVRPHEIGLRVNPGTGAGGNNRTTTGGVNSSFGLWHEYIDEAFEKAGKNNVCITRLHIHYGSGADPAIWGGVMDAALDIAARLPDASILNVGGGFKVKRAEGEKEADMENIAALFSNKLKEFSSNTGRKLRLEIEPGTWLVAHAGTLLAEVVDVVDTGVSGRTFLRLNTGMNDLIRPTMYGAQHKITVLNGATKKKKYIVVGHNCETGDVLTPAPGNPEELAERELNIAAIGDTVAVYDAGAYGRYFAVSGYNSFPSAQEICV